MRFTVGTRYFGITVEIFRVGPADPDLDVRLVRPARSGPHEASRRRRLRREVLHRLGKLSGA